VNAWGAHSLLIGKGSAEDFGVTRRRRIFGTHYYVKLDIVHHISQRGNIVKQKPYRFVKTLSYRICWAKTLCRQAGSVDVPIFQINRL
jgi:hypothetical protein